MQDEEIIRRLTAALRDRAAPDIEAILARAYDSAVDDAIETLEALITRSILEQAAAHLAPGGLDGEPSVPPPEQPAASGTAHRPAHRWAWYVYGVQRTDADLPAGLAGILGASVDGVEARGLRAIVSKVPGTELDEQALRDKLEDLEWVGATARAHEAVLGAALAAGPVVPLSFGTVFHQRRAVVEMLVRHADEVHAAVGRMAGRSEWGAKVLVDTAACDAWIEQHGAAPVGASTGRPARDGRDYLAQRRATREAQDERRRLLLDLATDAHERLSGLAVESCTDPPQNPELSGHEGEMIVNGAYLLDEASVETFHEAAGELAERHRSKGLSVQVTGPWPPHHFVSLGPIDDGETA